MLIRRLIPSDAAAFQALRLAGLRDCPTAFSSSYEEEHDTSLATIVGYFAVDSGRNFFGAFEGDQLVGMIGVGRESMRKLMHKGFIRGMYLQPAHRGQGGGRMLLDTALAFARAMPHLRQVNLTVTADNDAAIGLYRAAGFESYGRERAALLVDGVMHDNMHMVRTF